MLRLSMHRRENRSTLCRCAAVPSARASPRLPRAARMQSPAGAQGPATQRAGRFESFQESRTFAKTRCNMGHCQGLSILSVFLRLPCLWEDALSREKAAVEHGALPVRDLACFRSGPPECDRSNPIIYKQDTQPVTTEPP